jgi:hypothetical protein
MNSLMIDGAVLNGAALALYDEAYQGPKNAKGTWFVDNEPDCGVIGTLENLSLERATAPLSAGDPISAAAHAAHLLFALSLANRAAKGENPYATAKWSESWNAVDLDAAAFRELIAALRREYLAFRDFIASGKAWADETMMTGTLGAIAHGAWHLGAIRQGLGLVRSPEKK